MSRTPIAGIHHLKMFVTNLDESLAWWERALGAQRNPNQDHRTDDGALYAYILTVPGVACAIELRLSPVGAGRCAGFDPVTFVVEDRSDLTELAGRWDDAGIAHSPILRGAIGWLLAVRTPDDLSLRFYTNETHPWGTDVPPDSPWLSAPGGLFTA